MRQKITLLFLSGTPGIFAWAPVMTLGEIGLAAAAEKSRVIFAGASAPAYPVSRAGPWPVQRLTQEALLMLFADPTLTEFYRDLHIDREWSVCAPTHFTWWADQQAQHITVRTADAALDDEDPGVLIAVRTELLRGVTLDATAASALNSRLMAFASLAGPIYDPATGSVALHSLLRVHDDTRPWLTRLLSLAAVLQISEARRLAPELARLLGAEVAVSGPPERGIRPVADEMTGVVPQLIAPQGCAPSRWLAAEFLDIRDQYLQQPPALLATGDGAGLTVEFPWDDTHTALLQIMGDQPHPEYGNGLFVLQSFPVGEIDEAAGQRLALRLNAVELAEEPAGYGLGSYCYQRNLLHFVSFFPNFAYRPGLLPNLYYAAAQRAQALADRRYPALTADDGHE